VTSRFTIVAAGLGASAVAVWLILSSTHDDSAPRTIALLLLVSWSFLVAGLVAVARSPGRFGLLMCAVGLAVNLSALTVANGSVPFTVGLIVGSVWIAILVQALVAFPTGRLPSRTAVATVGAAYAVLTVGQLVVLLFDDLADDCPECPDNAVLIAADDTAASVADAAVGVVGAAIALAAALTGRRVALIASCDHGHAHDASGPYGYNPRAKEFDERVVELVRENRLGALLELDRALLEEAKVDSYWQMLMLHGALSERWRGEVLSYEAPTYFGMLCAAYAPAT
jgi:aromatic ring-opening dioxygenase LigB subunit